VKTEAEHVARAHASMTIVSLWTIQSIVRMCWHSAESAPSVAQAHPVTKPALVVELAQRSMEQVAHRDAQLQLDRDLRHVELFAGDHGLAWNGSANMGVVRAAHLQRTYMHVARKRWLQGMPHGARGMQWSWQAGLGSRRRGATRMLRRRPHSHAAI
jgi:hypothetical protein